MASTPTKSGHGGKRAGAGRKPAPKAPTQTVAEPLTAKDFLIKTMVGEIKPSAEQLKAAITLFGKHVEGVKDEKKAAAKKAGTGKFASAPAPLSVVK
jgi:hypothetical protein